MGAAQQQARRSHHRYVERCEGPLPGYRTGGKVYGIVGIAMEGVPLDPFENSVLLSILGECALALEGIRSAREKEEAAVLAKNEQLRANLLRAISHDLRTPDLHLRQCRKFAGQL